MRITCALLAIVAACESQGSEAAEREADTTAQRDSVAAVAAGTMRDEHVIALLEQTHAADSAVGLLGAQKGTATEVKDFGRMILREHHALRRDAAAVAQQIGIIPEAPPVAPDEPPTAMRDLVVTGEPGAGWDRVYLDYAIAVHSSALENTARALAATKRPEVTRFIEKSVPILQKHLDKARSLRRTLPKS